MDNRQKMEAFITKFIKTPYKEALIKNIKPSIRLVSKSEKPNKTGTTKLGGTPDLPISIEWPKSKFDNSPYSFLAQINLSEINDVYKKSPLPKIGMLYFFFHLDLGDDGMVLFTNEMKNLQPRPSPIQLRQKKKKKSLIARIFFYKKQARILEECAVELSKTYFLPACDSLIMEKIQLESKTSIGVYDAFEKNESDKFYSLKEDTQPDHHLLGYYNGIQPEYRELDLIKYNSHDHNLGLETINKAIEWVLLFQLSSDDNLKLNYVDGGNIYFFIHKDDLEKHEFHNIKITSDFY